MVPLDNETKSRLINLASALIDQERAQILVEPQAAESGYWFGGGNIVHHNNAFYIVGRYRNAGDSRTGVGAGERGLELAVLRSNNFYGPYQKVQSWSKTDLEINGVETVSIEGSALLVTPERGVELFISTEKANSYPTGIEAFQKTGTGVWSIDLMAAPTIEELSPASLQTVLASNEPARLHFKDPNVFETGAGTLLGFCNHPYSWSSSNSSLALRSKDAAACDYQLVTHDALTRGPVWDVACTRLTDTLGVPRLGALAEAPIMALHFYDGAECLRALDENPSAVARPRGYSCEELGGLAYSSPMEFPKIHRLSIDRPLFVSPTGTGCSRYVSTTKTEDGIFAIWQRSESDLSQPLVGHHLPMSEVENLLG